MRLYYTLSIPFLLIFIHTLSPTSLLFAGVPVRRASEHGASKPVILFDLMNVVIKENSAGFAKKIGYGNIASYTLTHWKHPGYRCLDMLDTMSKHETQKPHIHLTLKNRTMPRCLIALQEGKNTAAQTKDEILNGIALLDTQKYFNSPKEKMLMTTIMSVILDPDTTACMIESIKSTIQLAQKLKAAGYPIYIFANAPAELYTAVQKKYPDIISIFDGVIVSSEVKVIKPDSAIFNHLFTTHNREPRHYILIDDLPETVAAAEKMGMQAFVYDKNVVSKLRKCGVRF